MKGGRLLCLQSRRWESLECQAGSCCSSTRNHIQTTEAQWRPRTRDPFLISKQCTALAGKRDVKPGTISVSCLWHPAPSFCLPTPHLKEQIMIKVYKMSCCKDARRVFLLLLLFFSSCCVKLKVDMQWKHSMNLEHHNCSTCLHLHMFECRNAKLKITHLVWNFVI